MREKGNRPVYLLIVHILLLDSLVRFFCIADPILHVNAFKLVINLQTAGKFLI